jgi:hypothetical protein
MEQLTDKEKMRIAFFIFCGSMRSGALFDEVAALAEKIGGKKEMEHWKSSWEFERPIIEQFLNPNKKKQ